jgi:hypothetical protein
MNTTRSLRLPMFSIMTPGNRFIASVASQRSCRRMSSAVMRSINGYSSATSSARAVTSTTPSWNTPVAAPSPAGSANAVALTTPAPAKPMAFMSQRLAVVHPRTPGARLSTTFRIVTPPPIVNVLLCCADYFPRRAPDRAAPVSGRWERTAPRRRCGSSRWLPGLPRRRAIRATGWRGRASGAAAAPG